MSKKLSIVGISNKSIHAILDENLLYRSLNNIEGLKVEAGIRLEPPSSHKPDEAQAPGYTAYVARATYPGKIEKLRAELSLLPLTETAGLDLTAVPEELSGPEKKLIIMDVDSTLITQEVIDQLAAQTGQADRVAAITHAAMRGEIDFEKSLQERVGVLEGQPETILDEVATDLTFTAGAQELIHVLHEHGHVVAAVSGGFIEILTPLSEKVNLDYARANKLEIHNNFLTGKLTGEIITADKKREALREWAEDAGISAEHIIAVGDGANDELMMNEAALGIAFNAKPSAREKADAQINVERLDAVRHFLGI